jgi:hypothetical protein
MIIKPPLKDRVVCPSGRSALPYKHSTRFC